MLSPALAAEEACLPSVAPTIEASRVIDEVWTGAGVQFGGLETGGVVLAAYYTPDRSMALTQVPLNGGAVRRTLLPSIFSGWDSHNAIAIGTAPDGSIHVAGNMHASPLVYFRSAGLDQPFALSGMVGRDEQRMTYPSFMQSASNLYFLYRDGGSGNGKWLVNQWFSKGWQRIGIVFSDRGFGKPISAYPSFVMDSAGTIHVVTVWRKTPDVSTNVRLSYARTTDLRAWFKSDGTPISGPLTPENMDTVADVGENGGLLHGRVSIDVSGRPVVAFTQYAPDGRNSIAVASQGTVGWEVVTVAKSVEVHRFEGLGSIPDSIAMTAVNFVGMPTIVYRFPGEKKLQQRLDPKTLIPVCPPTAASPDVASLASEQLKGQIPLSVPVINAQRKWLTWSAQPAFRDRPRECTKEAPTACRPPASTLRLVSGTMN